MLLTDSELLALGIKMTALKPWVVDKLRQKAATYEDCMSSARYLAWSAYAMEGAPDANPEAKEYLEAHFGPIKKGATGCLVCRAPLQFDLFIKPEGGKQKSKQLMQTHASTHPATLGLPTGTAILPKETRI